MERGIGKAFGTLDFDGIRCSSGILTDSGTEDGRWTHYGTNPARTGVYDTEGVETEPSEDWRFRPHDDFYVNFRQSPLIYEGSLYVADWGGDNLYRLNPQDASILQKKEIDGISGTPAIDEGTIYVGGDGVFFALDAETFETVWEQSGHNGSFGVVTVADDAIAAERVNEGYTYFDKDGEVLNSASRSDTYSASATDGSLFYQAVQEFFSALNPDGTYEWWVEVDESDDGESATTPPTVYADGDRAVFSTGRRTYIVDTSSGDVVARFDAGSVSPHAVTDDSIYFVPFQHDDYDAIDANEPLVSIDAETAELEWVAEDSTGDFQPHPTYVDGTVYVGTRFSSFGGGYSAVDADDGSVLWNWRPDDSGDRFLGFIPPAVHDGAVYLGTEDADNDDADSYLYRIS